MRGYSRCRMRSLVSFLAIKAVRDLITRNSFTAGPSVLPSSATGTLRGSLYEREWSYKSAPLLPADRTNRGESAIIFTKMLPRYNSTKCLTNVRKDFLFYLIPFR